MIDEAQEPRANIAWLIEMASYPLCVTSDRKGQSAKIGHRRKYRFIGNIVTDENRPPSGERLVI